MRKCAEKQHDAARNNGKLSRGPVTPQGKNEAPETLCFMASLPGPFIITKQYRNFLQSENALGQALIEEQAAAFWRMRCFWAIENVPNKNLPGKADPDFGLRPPNVDQFADDPDGYISGINRITSFFTSLAGTPEFKLIPTRRPLASKRPAGLPRPDAAPRRQVKLGEMKTEKTNPRGTISVIPISLAESLICIERKANIRQKYLLSMYQKRHENTRKNTPIRPKTLGSTLGQTSAWVPLGAGPVATSKFSNLLNPGTQTH
jgi:hypothetical protein